VSFSKLRTPSPLLLCVAAVAALAAAYRGFLRKRVLFWGATPQEATADLPGDTLIEIPDEVTTRATTINAPRSAVWPWLAQMGPSPRGGAYTYDWIENLLGLGIHSVDEVLPQFQNPEAGDAFSFGANEMRVACVEGEEAICWLSDDGNWSWSFLLREEADKTRLISRNRFRLPTLGMRVGKVPMELGSLAMERKMLEGIKVRAERLAKNTTE
jgi:hypothetical protein